MDSSQLNDRVFELLAEVEDDQSLPHELAHYIYDESEKLARLREQLVAQGYEVFPLRDGVLAKAWFMLDEAVFDREIARVEKLAGGVGCQYDGWETATRQRSDGGPLSLAPN